MTRPKQRRLEFLGDFLAGHLRELGWGRRIAEEEVLVRWEEAVGPSIARHARPSHFNGQRLTVVTESPVWTQQLALMAPDLLRCIARHFGPGVVAALYFVTGRIDPPQEPAAASASAPAVPVAIPASLDTDLAAIPDLEVRESVRGLILAALAEEARGSAGS